MTRFIKVPLKSSKMSNLTGGTTFELDTDVWAMFYNDMRDNENGREEADHLLDIARVIHHVYIWILLAVGLPGNTLTIATILTIQKLCPLTFLVAILAALDCVALISKVIGHQLASHGGQYVGDAGCKSEFLLLYVVTLANWILALICAERFVTICHRVKKAVVFSMRNCYIVVPVLAIMLFGIFAGISIPMRVATPDGRRCGTAIQYSTFWSGAWFWINASLYLFIPCLFVLPMTALMVRTLYKNSHRDSTTLVQEKDVSKDEPAATVCEEDGITETEISANEGSFTLMIILAALLFVVLSLPACIYYLAYRPSTDQLTEARWILFGQIQFVLADSSHAINFLLYFLSASRFRAQVWYLISCQKCGAQ